MNTLKCCISCIVFLLLLVVMAGTAFGKEKDLMYEFQLDQLLDPSDEQLSLEQEGHIFIYSGLKDSDIKLALDTQQHRMQSMMFVNVIWTDEEGKPIVDPYTGQIVSDDDC